MKELPKQLPHAHFECLIVGLAACLRSASHYRVTDIPETSAYFSPDMFSEENLRRLVICVLSAATRYPDDPKEQAQTDIWPFACVSDLGPDLELYEDKSKEARPLPVSRRTHIAGVVRKRVVDPHFVSDITAPEHLGFKRLTLVEKTYGHGRDLARLVIGTYEPVLVRMCKAIFEESRKAPFGTVFVQADQGRLSQSA